MMQQAGCGNPVFWDRPMVDRIAIHNCTADACCQRGILTLQINGSATPDEVDEIADHLRIFAQRSRDMFPAVGERSEQ